MQLFRVVAARAEHTTVLSRSIWGKMNGDVPPMEATQGRLDFRNTFTADFDAARQCPGLGLSITGWDSTLWGNTCLLEVLHYRKGGGSKYCHVGSVSVQGHVQSDYRREIRRWRKPTGGIWSHDQRLAKPVLAVGGTTAKGGSGPVSHWQSVARMSGFPMVFRMAG